MEKRKVIIDEFRGVVIDKYPDRLVLRNPGTAIVGKQQMIHGGESEPRNSNIMKMFNLIGYGERAGSGVPDIFAVWREAAYEEPTVEEQFGSGRPNRMIVTLPLMKKSVPKETVSTNNNGAENGAENCAEQTVRIDGKNKIAVEKRIEAVYRTIHKNTNLTEGEIATILGITRRQVQLATNKLRENGKISRKGSDAKGQWVINEEWRSDPS